MSENWHKVEATTVGCTPPPSLPKTVEKDPGKPDLGEAATLQQVLEMSVMSQRQEQPSELGCPKTCPTVPGYLLGGKHSHTYIYFFFLDKLLRTGMPPGAVSGCLAALVLQCGRDPIWILSSSQE